MFKSPPSEIIPAMVTPFTKDQEVNEKALRRLVKHCIDGGVHGVFAVGSQGEFWALTPDEKRRIWNVVVEETAGRVPVYAGTVGVTTRGDRSDPCGQRSRRRRRIDSDAVLHLPHRR